MRSKYQMFSRIANCLIAGLFAVSAVSYSQDEKNNTEVLKKVADVPMPGPAVRFDYQTFDPSTGRVYIAHMNADQLVVFDTSKRQVVANLDGFKRVADYSANRKLGSAPPSLRSLFSRFEIPKDF
jgi:hypothetical protein